MARNDVWCLFGIAAFINALFLFARREEASSGSYRNTLYWPRNAWCWRTGQWHTRLPFANGSYEEKHAEARSHNQKIPAAVDRRLEYAIALCWRMICVMDFKKIVVSLRLLFSLACLVIFISTSFGMTSTLAGEVTSVEIGLGVPWFQHISGPAGTTWEWNLLAPSFLAGIAGIVTFWGSLRYSGNNE